MSNPLTWHALDASKADYGAKAGAMARGADGARIVLLELPSGAVAIVGHMTAASRADAERHAAGCYASERDRYITAATFNGWKESDNG